MKKMSKLGLLFIFLFMLIVPTVSATPIEGMLGDSPPDGTIASADITYTTYSANNAIDKDKNTRWTANSSNAVLELTFPKALELDFIQIASHGSNYKVSYTISGLQNGMWEVISPKTTFKVPNGTSILDPIEVTKGSYDAIKIQVSESVEWINILEITLGSDSSTPSEPEPNPQPGPSGDRAILTVTMLTGLEKEYDLSMDEVSSFINWYDDKDAGAGPSKYAINKHDNNRGPFSKRTDYVIFNNILTFEVSEYSTVTTATYQ